MEAKLCRHVDVAETTGAEGPRKVVKEINRSPDCGPSSTAAELPTDGVLQIPGLTLTLSNSDDRSRDGESLDIRSSTSDIPVTQVAATRDANEGSIFSRTGRRISDFASNVFGGRTPNTTTRIDAEASEPIQTDRGEPSTLLGDDSFELVDVESDGGEDIVVKKTE
ncbi:hypothetical protein LTR37_013302 [Vermiconidia calcicola]|uniref:Uncharacterized protein n=1 Tax=Vermiconidia calcicola TaxID=1690605 RepID=A0ACC3MXK3_9PEZI|nr:hypothetical protein LTR37_013302 [Vermiconidia calcicola]